MIKKLLLVLALTSGLIMANGLENSKKMHFTSMNKADSQFLFDGSTNAIALSDQEMKNTEGEWVPLFWFAYRFGPSIWNHRQNIMRVWRYTVTYNTFGIYNNWR